MSKKEFDFHLNCEHEWEYDPGVFKVCVKCKQSQYCLLRSALYEVIKRNKKYDSIPIPVLKKAIKPYL